MKPSSVLPYFSSQQQANAALKKAYRQRILVVIIPSLILLILDLTGDLRWVVPILVLLPLYDLRNQLKIWRLHVRSFGLPSPRAIWLMWKLDAMRGYTASNTKDTNRGHVLEMASLFIGIGGAFWAIGWWMGSGLVMFFGTICIMLAIKALIRRGRPPAVLFLSASSSEASQLQMQLQGILHPLVAISLLYHRDTTVQAVNMVLHFFSFRTANDAVWQEAVLTLLRITPLTVIDIRTATAPVQFEIDHALQMLPPERLFFVGQADDPRIPTARCFSEFEVTDLLRRRRHKVKSPKTAPLKLYEDERNSYFSFVPPLGWVKQGYEDTRSKVSFHHPHTPEIYMRWIVRELTPGERPPDARQSMYKIAQLGMNAELKAGTLAGVPCDEVWAVSAKQTEFIRLQLLVIEGLFFSIETVAPTQALFDQQLGTVDQALNTLVVH
ncbi:MAG: hypothetical protein F9K46_14790, partial [Anaerolineae bacterium]